MPLLLNNTGFFLVSPLTGKQSETTFRTRKAVKPKKNVQDKSYCSPKKENIPSTSASASSVSNQTFRLVPDSGDHSFGWIYCNNHDRQQNERKELLHGFFFFF